MTDRWRCFVAIPLPPSLHPPLADAVSAWKDAPELEGLRWTDAGGWHVTLAFLGWLEPDAVAGVVETVREIAAEHGPMNLHVGGLGAFPAPGKSRVVWIGVSDPGGGLRHLAGAVRSALEIDGESPFRAHLTLARATREPIDIRGWLASAVSPTGPMEVDRIELMRSHLGRGPARYESIAAARLGVPAHV